MPLVTEYLMRNPQIRATRFIVNPADEMEKINAMMTTGREGWEKQRDLRKKHKYCNHTRRDECFGSFSQMAELVEQISAI